MFKKRPNSWHVAAFLCFVNISL